MCCAFRGVGVRPAGWVGRGPGFMGEIGRVMGLSSDRVISSP